VILFYGTEKKSTRNPQYTPFDQRSIDKSYTHTLDTADQTTPAGTEYTRVGPPSWR